ncbi:unnamed protein product [Lathyrus sativus]|nr:unnamed protein product [Lathyrus sativus]
MLVLNHFQIWLKCGNVGVRWLSELKACNKRHHITYGCMLFGITTARWRYTDSVRNVPAGDLMFCPTNSFFHNSRIPSCHEAGSLLARIGVVMGITNGPSLSLFFFK